MITIYSKNNCPHCVAAEQILQEKGVSYTIKKIDENSEARNFLIENGHRTVPQVYADNELLVKNYRELAEMDTEDLKGK